VRQLFLYYNYNNIAKKQLFFMYFCAMNRESPDLLAVCVL
jgi:hypothetical protein